MIRKYVYGVIKASQLGGTGGRGLQNAPVQAMVRNNLVCLVSDYSGPDFNRLPPEKLTPYRVAHQAVIRRIVAERAILPMKFGTILGSDGEVLSLLAQGDILLQSALRQIEGKVEIAVEATWDTERVIRELLAREQTAHAIGAIRTWPSGAVSQNQLDLAVRQALTQSRDSYREYMMAYLKPLAVDAQSNPLVSNQMVASLVFLLHTEKQEKFSSYVARLNGLFSDQISFRVFGPRPPYTFATLEVKRFDCDQIEWARESLHLGELVSEYQIRKAFQSLAIQAPLVPSRNTEADRNYLPRLREAADILLYYCRSPMALGVHMHRSLPTSRRAVEQLFYFTIGRPSAQEGADGSLGSTLPPGRPAWAYAAAG